MHDDGDYWPNRNHLSALITCRWVTLFAVSISNVDGGEIGQGDTIVDEREHEHNKHEK